MGSERAIVLMKADGDQGVADEAARYLGEVGFDVQQRQLPISRGSEVLWDLMIMLPLQGALTAMGSEAVKEAFRAVRGAIQKKVSKDEVEDPAVLLSDVSDETQLLLTATTPDEALQSLEELMSNGRLETGRTYSYSTKQGEWVIIRRAR